MPVPPPSRRHTPLPGLPVPERCGLGGCCRGPRAGTAGAPGSLPSHRGGWAGRGGWCGGASPCQPSRCKALGVWHARHPASVWESSPPRRAPSQLLQARRPARAGQRPAAESPRGGQRPQRSRTPGDFLRFLLLLFLLFFLLPAESRTELGQRHTAAAAKSRRPRSLRGAPRGCSRLRFSVRAQPLPRRPGCSCPAGGCPLKLPACLKG